MKQHHAFTLAGAVLGLAAVAAGFLWQPSSTRQAIDVSLTTKPKFGGAEQSRVGGLQPPATVRFDEGVQVLVGDAPRLGTFPPIHSPPSPREVVVLPKDVVVNPGDLVIRSGDGEDCCDQLLRAGTYSIKDGMLTIYHPDGTVAEVGGWDGSARQGYWEDYDTNGQRILAGSYLDGRAVGHWMKWHSNGVMAEQTEVFEGKFDGARTVWDENGVLIAELSGVYSHGTKLN